jgi:cell division protein FtsQ
MRIVKKILVILGWICLAGAIGFTVFYAYSEWIAVRCQSIVVNINPNSPRFLDEDEIVAIIEKSGEPIIGQRLSAINIYKLETKLSTYTTFDHVEIFRKVDSKGISFKGKLVISLDERTPVVRFKSSTEDYYMDMGGIKVPVSPKYVERILLATGTVPTDEAIKKELLKMTDFVNKDEFWRAQIEQVFIQENGELLLVPQVGDYVIEFGTPDDYQSKFRNLKAVYQQGFKNLGWNRYKTISVKYRNQVVCTKK